MRSMSRRERLGPVLACCRGLGDDECHGFAAVVAKLQVGEVLERCVENLAIERNGQQRGLIDCRDISTARDQRSSGASAATARVTQTAVMATVSSNASQSAAANRAWHRAIPAACVRGDFGRD